MNILFAIPVNKVQAKGVYKTLKAIKESGNYDFGNDRAVVIIANDFAQAEITKDIFEVVKDLFSGYDSYVSHDYDNTSPVTALNHIFRCAMQYVYDIRKDVDGFFFFQPDITPIKKDWWDIVKREFERSQALCLYAPMDILNEKKQSVGSIPAPCAFYHKTCPEKIRSLYGSRELQFNDLASWDILQNAKKSEHITDVTYDQEIEIDSQKVLIIGDVKDRYKKMLKDGTNFIVIRDYEIEALPINIKQAVSFLNYRILKGEVDTVKKEIEDSGLLEKMYPQKICQDDGKHELTIDEVPQVSHLEAEKTVKTTKKK